MQKIFIGQGYDIHKTTQGNEIILGGVKIKCSYSLKGHSDADVVTHALIDAILGAMCMEDIGQHFPNTKEYENCDSIALLKRTMQMIENATIINADITIVMESPKLGPYKKQIKNKLASIINTNRVNIKAKTNEGCDDTGQLKCIQCFASVLMQEK